LWIEELGLAGKNSYDKFIPDFVFGLCAYDLALFIGRLWSGDGFVWGENNTLPFYASSSQYLIFQLQELLSRTGIVAKIHRKTFKYSYKGLRSDRIGYTLILQGRESIENFLKVIVPHIIGRDDQIQGMKAYYSSVGSGNDSKDVIPSDIKLLVQELKDQRGWKWRDLEKASGVSMKEFVGGRHVYQKGFRRSTIRRLADFFDSPQLRLYVDSDIFWDTIVSVEYAGKKPTYDLQIEKHHNFCANGLVVHNSHSTAYALISYRTAYLKANYPVEFMAAMLTSERNNTDKVVEYVGEAGRMGIKVLPPDINTSYANFTVTSDNNIRFGLMAIKNVGETALASIIEVRRQKGFESIFDFCERVDTRTVNKKVIESLIKVGAMDSFKLKRAQMMAMMDRLLNKSAKKVDTSQMVLFSQPKDESVPDIEEWPLNEILSFEKSLLGIYLTSHPLYHYMDVLKFVNRAPIIALYGSFNREEILVCGIVEKIKMIVTRKKGERMAIVKLEDETANLEVFVFPRLFEQEGALLREKSIFVIKGKLEVKEKTPKILASSIMPVENILSTAKEIKLAINKDNTPLLKLKNILLNNRGHVPVLFVLQGNKFQGMKVKASQDFYFAPTAENLKEISELVGEENVFVCL